MSRTPLFTGLLRPKEKTMGKSQNGADLTGTSATDGSGIVYEINSVSDFLKIPEDRVEACLEEFCDFIEMGREIENIAKVAAELIGVPPETACSFDQNFNQAEHPNELTERRNNEREHKR
jgi:hypothetical protein